MASSPGRPAHQRLAWFPVGDVGGEVGDLVLGDVRRVRHHEPQPAAQRFRQRVEPRAGLQPHPGGGRAHPGEVGAGDGQRVLAHVGGPHLGVGELTRQRQRDRARARAEVGDRERRRRAAPRIVRAPARAEPHDLVDRGARHHLGLRTRDEHAPVDHEVEPEEVPPAEHVLQRLAGGAPRRACRRGAGSPARSRPRARRPPARRRRSRRRAPPSSAPRSPAPARSVSRKRAAARTRRSAQVVTRPRRRAAGSARRRPARR